MKHIETVTGNYTVYMHVSKIDGRKYIGITSRQVKHRWKDGRGYDVYTPFGKAIYEQGFDSFEHIILATNIDAELAYQLEAFYIRYYKTTNINYGFNMTVAEFKECRDIEPKVYDYQEKVKTNNEYLESIISFDDTFKEFAKQKKILCTKMIAQEYLKLDHKLTRSESLYITAYINSLPFIKKRNGSTRITPYGVQKVWEYIGD